MAASASGSLWVLDSSECTGTHAPRCPKHEPTPDWAVLAWRPDLCAWSAVLASLHACNRVGVAVLADTNESLAGSAIGANASSQPAARMLELKCALTKLFGYRLDAQAHLAHALPLPFLAPWPSASSSPPPIPGLLVARRPCAAGLPPDAAHLACSEEAVNNETVARLAQRTSDMMLRLHPRDPCTSEGAFTLNENTTWPAAHHYLDKGIANVLLQIVAGGSLLDIGAGSGQYGAYFEKWRRLPPNMTKGIAAPLYTGVDGMRNVEEFTTRLGPPGSVVTYSNICDEAETSTSTYDWVMSFEVGEHLPTWCLATYLRRLDRSSRKGLLLSWSAVQSGQCHVNARDSSSIDCTLRLLGYEVDKHWSVHARHRAHISWMKHGFVVYRRRAANSIRAAPLVGRIPTDAELAVQGGGAAVVEGTPISWGESNETSDS